MLYKPYSDEHVWKEEDKISGETKKQKGGYTSFIAASETLFWGLYGMAGVDNTELVTVTSHYKALGHNETKETHHKMTESTGRILYAGRITFIRSVIVQLQKLEELMLGYM
jgi:hypothetical protein